MEDTEIHKFLIELRNVNRVVCRRIRSNQC